MCGVTSGMIVIRSMDMAAFYNNRRIRQSDCTVKPENKPLALETMWNDSGGVNLIIPTCKLGTDSSLWLCMSEMFSLFHAWEIGTARLPSGPKSPDCKNHKRGGPKRGAAPFATSGEIKNNSKCSG